MIRLLQYAGRNAKTVTIQHIFSEKGHVEYTWLFLVVLPIDRIERMFYNLNYPKTQILLKYRKIWTTIKKNVCGGFSYGKESEIICLWHADKKKWN